MFNYKDINTFKNIKKFNLKNGITLIIDQVESCKSTSLGFYLKKGSRDENANQAGYYHFAEHMLFKGTEKYNQKEIAKFFDTMGGNINAYTTHELVVLYDYFPFYNFEKTAQMMFEIFNNSNYDSKEFETEKNVIISEIRSEYEDPHEKVHEDFMKNIFNAQTLGLPIIGTEKSIKSVTRDELFNFYNENFTKEELFIVISGKIEPDTAIKIVENFNFKQRSNKYISKEAFQNNKKKYYKTIHPSEQCHIVTGTTKFNLNQKQMMQINLLNLILGESMSSRLFQKVREELGLCYSTYSFSNKFRHENLYGIYMSVMPDKVNKSINAVSEVLQELIKNGITKEELDQAKQQKVGEYILNSDSIQKRMQRIAMMNIILDKIYTLEEMIEITQNTQISDINELIKNIFNYDNFITQILYKKNIKTEEWQF